jgi:hypothetical protein
VFIRGRPDASFVLPYQTPNLHVLVWLCERMPALVAIQAAVQVPRPGRAEQAQTSPAITAHPEIKIDGGGAPPAPAPQLEQAKPAQPVAGFPAHDPHLGRFLCGKPCRQRLVILSLVFAAVYLAIGLVNFLGPGTLTGTIWTALLAVVVPGIGLVLLGGLRDGPHLLGCAVGLFFVVLLAVGMISAWVDQPGKESFSVAQAPLWIPLALALAGLASWGTARREGFAVYEEGLRDSRHALRWSDSRHLTYSVVDTHVNLAQGVRTVALTLEGTGKPVSIGGRDVTSEACCQAVLQRVLPLLVARAWQAVASGGEFRAGGVRVSREGLTYKARQVPWSAVRSLKPHLGRLYLWIEGQEQPFLNEDLNVRNRRVLLALLEVMGRQNR